MIRTVFNATSIIEKEDQDKHKKLNIMDKDIYQFMHKLDLTESQVLRITIESTTFNTDE